MRKAWFKLTRNATGRQLLWELVTTESARVVTVLQAAST